MSSEDKMHPGFYYWHTPVLDNAKHKLALREHLLACNGLSLT